MTKGKVLRIQRSSKYRPYNIMTLIKVYHPGWTWPSLWFRQYTLGYSKGAFCYWGSCVTKSLHNQICSKRVTESPQETSETSLINFWLLRTNYLFHSLCLSLFAQLKGTTLPRIGRFGLWKPYVTVCYRMHMIRKIF